MDDQIFYRDKGSKADFQALFLSFKEFDVLKWPQLPFETRLTWIIHWADQAEKLAAFEAGAQGEGAGMPELQAVAQGLILDDSGGEDGRYWCGSAGEFLGLAPSIKLRVLRDCVDTYFATARLLGHWNGNGMPRSEELRYLEGQHSKVGDMLDAVTFSVQ